MQISIIIVVAVCLGVTILSIISLINRLIGLKNSVAYAGASVDAMLKLRLDLIPNLISCVERYMKHEREVLEELTRCRSQAASGNGQVSHAFRSLFAQAENYPQLMASDNFRQLQAALNDAEAQIAASRRAYNAAVTDYNNGCRMFPHKIVAGILGYHPETCFEIPDSERQSIVVNRIWS